MVDDGLKARINMKIDGMLSAAEAEELDRKLAADPEARAYYNGLAKVSEMLSSIPVQAPPATLKQKIMGSLPANKSTQTRQAPVVSGLLRKLRARLTYRPAYVFAAGLAFGLFAAALLGDIFQARNPRTSDLVGSMTPAGDLLQRLPVEHAQVHGTIAVERTDGLLSLRFELTSRQSVALRLQFSRPVRLARAVHQSGGFGESMAFSGEELKMSIHGESRFDLSFAAGVDGFRSMRITLSQEALLYEKTLNVNSL